MHHVVTLIAERQRSTCTNWHHALIAECYVSYVQGLMQNYHRAVGGGGGGGG
ncbi:hypothetical protein Hanom_Chr10g00953281 [Helianthus anomalus]